MVIVNDSGRQFYVRVVFQGEKYGLDDKLTHREADPLVEFYDYTYAGQKTFGPRGQFVSRYYAQTLAQHKLGLGLSLDGGVPAWTVDGEALRLVLFTARAITKGERPSMRKFAVEP